MTYLILLTVSLGLLGGFFALTQFEERRGMRYFMALRTAFDGQVSKIEFFASHIDWSSFFKEQVSTVSLKVSHDVAHGSLQGVRAIERTLTQFVRRLRSTHSSLPVSSRDAARPFVRTLSEFKGHLEATRPEMPEI